MSDKATEIVISAPVTDLATKIKEHLSVDKKTGVITAAADIYKTCLPDDMSADTVQRVRDHDTTFVAAAVKAVGDVSLPVLTKNKELESTTAVVEMLAKSHVAVDFKRVEEFPNPKEKGTTITKYGTTKVEVHHAAGHNAGELKKVRNWLKEEAEKALA